MDGRKHFRRSNPLIIGNWEHTKFMIWNRFCIHQMLSIDVSLFRFWPCLVFLYLSPSMGKKRERKLILVILHHDVRTLELPLRFRFEFPLIFLPCKHFPEPVSYRHSSTTNGFMSVLKRVLAVNDPVSRVLFAATWITTLEKHYWPGRRPN